METLELLTNVSEKEFASQICENLSEEFGVDVKALLLTPGISAKERIKLTTTHLMEAIILKAEYENVEGFDSTALKGMNLADFVANAIEIEPNISYSEKDAIALSNLQGQKLKDYLFTLTKRFENMAKAKTPGQLVAEMAGGALMSIGIPMGIQVVKSLIAKEALKVAMLNGVKAVGMKTAIVAVVLVLAGLLYYLLVENPKKILGMVVNNTDDDFVVNNYASGNGDLRMIHGQMVNFMEDSNGGIEAPKLQLKERLNYGEGNEDNMVFAGIYFADRNVGFRGAEGIAVFTSKSNPNFKFAHVFAVPYTNDNRSNIKIINGDPGNLDNLFRNLYDQNKQRVDYNDQGYRLTSTVNDPRGGVVGCIAYIGKI